MDKNKAGINHRCLIIQQNGEQKASRVEFMSANVFRNIG
jgi:hypothetical protein